jgi:DNA-binding NarL/FixJ family response regulator
LSLKIATPKKYHYLPFTYHLPNNQKKYNTMTTASTPAQIVASITKYYARGFTAKEIGKQMDINPRTVQRYIKDYNIAQKASPLPLATQISQLHTKGHSYTQIAKMCNVCKATVYNHVRKLKAQ